MVKECPKCSRLSSVHALVCDCGHHFQVGDSTDGHKNVHNYNRLPDELTVLIIATGVSFILAIFCMILIDNAIIRLPYPTITNRVMHYLFEFILGSILSILVLNIKSEIFYKIDKFIFSVSLLSFFLVMLYIDTSLGMAGYKDALMIHYFLYYAIAWFLNFFFTCLAMAYRDSL
jgi:hypothetical protein